jgi:hypothetical protein
MSQNFLNGTTQPLKPAMMSSAQGCLSFADAQPKLSQDITLLLAYRDGGHRLLGRSYFERISELENAQGPWGITEWKFEMLVVPSLRDLAIKDAVESPLVVIAARGGEELSPGLRLWLKEWATQRLFPGMLVVLLSSNPDYMEADCSEYFCLRAELGEDDIELVVYATGTSVERSNMFNFGAARRVTPEGLVMVTDFPELAALARNTHMPFDEPTG